MSKLDVFLWLTLNKCYSEVLKSSHRWCSVKKGVLRNFARFTGRHLCQSLFFNSWHRCFPVNFAKLLRTPFQQDTSRRLLLSFYKKILTNLKNLRQTKIQKRIQKKKKKRKAWNIRKQTQMPSTVTEGLAATGKTG